MKKNTHTSTILDLLIRRDDLMSIRDIVVAAHCSTAQAMAALSHMRKCRAVDLVVDQGTSYWFATPNSDNRSRCVDMREEEEPGSRKPRKRKPKKES